MVLAGSGDLRRARQRLGSNPTGTRCRKHMQSEVDSLVGRAKLARFASSCFRMQVILSFCKPVGPADLRLADWTDATGQLSGRQPVPQSR
jgi:hypothetical protein